MTPDPVFKTATIGRFDNLVPIGFRVGDTIGTLLSRSHLTLKTGEEINDGEGNAVAQSDQATEQTYYIVSNYKNACN